MGRSGYPVPGTVFLCQYGEFWDDSAQTRLRRPQDWFLMHTFQRDLDIYLWFSFQPPNATSAMAFADPATSEIQDPDLAFDPFKQKQVIIAAGCTLCASCRYGLGSRWGTRSVSDGFRRENDACMVSWTGEQGSATTVEPCRLSGRCVQLRPCLTRFW